MGNIVGGFYLGLANARAQRKTDEARSGFWLDLLTRISRLKPSHILLMGNNQVSAPHPAAPYSIGCAPQWQLATAQASVAITLAGCASLAGHIALHGYQHGLDWRLERDHHYDAPVHLLVPNLLQPLGALQGKAIPCVPVSLYSPHGTGLSFEQCLRLGQLINQAVRDQHSNVRVVVIACHGPVAWPDIRPIEGTHYQKDLLARAIEQVDLPALRALHQSAMDSRGRSALELLVCALMASAANHCQWLSSEKGRNGIQIQSDYLYSNNSPHPRSEHDEFIIDSARRRITRLRQPAWDD
ncbi:TPA: hypothetical protein L5634_001389 [Pseudomonas aeruginosa]|nr:hypothetical protein [Pseudomonas aeruginosa]